jgi:hypothetical protein
MASFGAPLAHISQLWLPVCLCTFRKCLVDSGDGHCGQHSLETWLVPDLNKTWKLTSLLHLKSLLLSSDAPPLLAHDHDCHNFCTFIFSNLAKSFIRWSPLRLHHTIEKKKHYFWWKVVLSIYGKLTSTIVTQHSKIHSFLPICCECKKVELECEF